MSGLFRHVVIHPVAVLMLFMAGLVFGWVSLQRLTVELMPDLSYPAVTVRTTWDGAAPQEVETQVSRPVEEALATLDGLVSLESRSRAGSSDVVLGFDWGTPMSGATQSIREKLQLLWLPDDAERPLILRYDPSLEPFLRVAVSRDTPAADPVRGLMDLRLLADQELKRDLEALKGVAAVRVEGGLEREIRVEVREDWLAARRLRLDQVRSALASENINLAGGSIVEGEVEYLVRTLNEYHTLDELRQLRIRRADGVSVPLSDVAIVREAPVERQVLTRLGGAEAVELELYKEAGANVVEVSRRVKDRLLYREIPPQMAPFVEAPLANDLPEGVVLRILDDQAAFIEDAISNLVQTAWLGGLLAVVVLFLFLRDFRATAIIGLAIPVSVILGFAPLYLNGVSLNLMSLGGLALGVGMLVDNSVVVLESIQRQREAGLDRRAAAVAGVEDVAAAVTASTLTTVAVFFPITFVEGVAGELFGDLAVAVVSSLVASLVVALFGVPILAAVQLVPPGRLDLGRPYRLVDDLLPRSLGEIGQIFIWARWRALLTGLSEHLFGEPMRELRAWGRRAEQRSLLLLAIPYVALRLALRVGWRLSLTPLQLLGGLATRAGLAAGGLVVGGVGWLALRVADVFQAVYGRVERGYVARLPGALRRPGLVLGAALVLLVASLWGGGRLGSQLIPEIHQGRFTVEVALPVGTPLVRTAGVVAEVERRIASHPQVEAVYSTVGVGNTADASADEGEHTARVRVELHRGSEGREEQVMEDLRGRLADLDDLTVTMSAPSLFSFETPIEVVVYGYDLHELQRAGDQVVGALAELDGLRDVRSSLRDGNPEVRIRYDRARLQRFGLDTATVAERVRDMVQGAVATEIRRADQRLDLRVQLVEEDRGTLEDLRRLNVNPSLVPPIPLVAVADFEEAVGPSEIRRVDQQRAVVVSANLQGFDLGGQAAAITDALADVALPGDMSWEIAGQSKEMEQSLSSMAHAMGLAVFLVYVIMASTFESLTHPFVILFSVPLAVVGVVVGLALTGSPVSVVVLIGGIVLAGVVVNNAIVLVDKVNRLRADGLPRDAALLRAGQLRLRPILITTATTVLGLLPLSLGLGAGAELQQPLAITVIAGLSASTLLTLVVVPVVYRVVSRRAPSAEPAPEPAETPA